VNLEQLKQLAAMAPVEESPYPPAPAQGPKTASRRGEVRPMENTLGTLELGAYLTHYGIDYKTKQQGALTLYLLKECVFDPNHSPYEASICYSPTPPFLTYQCFHQSCRGKTWKEARRAISGADSLAPFCANYDPQWKQKKSELGTRLMVDLDIGPVDPLETRSDIMVHGQPLPPPREIDPLEFFDLRGKRPQFVENWMAKYLAAQLGPICYTEGVYWRYEGGVWKEFPQEVIRQTAQQAMKDRVKSTYIDNSMKILAALVKRTEAQWTTDDRYVNCRNGMVDLKEAALLPHDPAYRSRTQIPCNFDMNATYDRWLRFLEEVFPEDDQKKPGELGKADLLQQFFGYCLLGDCRYQKALFLYGVGANGKSTAINALISVLGIENTSTLTIEDMSERFTTHFLQGKLLNFATETNTRNPMDTEKFKAAVRGDPLKAERKYGSPYNFSPTAKWVVAMNEAPVIPDKTPGFTRSIIVLEFKHRFVGGEIDYGLGEKLGAERDGIFMWTLFGLERLLKRNGFAIPSKVEEEGREFMRALNPLLLFVDEECTMGPQEEVGSTEFYNRYKEWCSDGHNRPLSRNKFADQILMHWPEVTKGWIGETTQRKRGFKGIGLKV